MSPEDQQKLEEVARNHRRVVMQALESMGLEAIRELVREMEDEMGGGRVAAPVPTRSRPRLVIV